LTRPRLAVCSKPNAATSFAAVERFGKRLTKGQRRDPVARILLKRRLA
jgi:hypothetical protein